MRHALSLFLAAVCVQSAGSSLLSPQKAAPKHLTVSTSASASRVAPGAKVSLFADVTPAPGIHVYAPGAKDFLPIALALTPTAGAAIGTTVYPKSEMLGAGDDEVPVFQKPFRLAQPVTIARTAAPGTMTIAGTIRYQACDDVVCFIPASVPVSWTIAIK
jgi:DsbC/DsbD-like thiol-disulfide interchange protein